MKGFLHSQDGSYAFPLGPKVTTIGRENCDISINSPQVDNQHALIEYDDEQRCFILKDLNSSTGTYVHDCRVQNAAVRLSHGDFIRFGFNGLPLEFRIEQQQQQQLETTMPSIYQRQSSSNSLQLITQTIPSRRVTSGITNHQQQIDVRQNPGFSLRGRPSSAGTKRTSAIITNTSSHGSNGIRDSVVPNAWTINNTSNPGRGVINGNFSGELEVPCQDNSEITNRVDQLEKEVKGRDAEIRELNDRLRSLEPMSSTFTNEVHTLRSELEKVKRDKQAASGLISSLQRDLHSKESDLAKLTREIEGLKTDGRDKDLRLQSLQAKLNLLRDRGRAEEDRFTKEKELVNLRNKIKLAEQQINELNESVNRLKSQLQDTEKQLLRLNQNEQKLKQECEHAREQLAEVQRNETTLRADLANAQEKHNEFCINIWKCFSNDNDDEYDEDQHNIIEQIQQIQQQLDQARSEIERQRDINSSSNEQFRVSLGKFIDILTSAMQEQTTANNLLHARQQMIELEESADNDSIVGMFKRAAINAVDSHAKLLSGINNLVIKRDDQQEDLSINEILAIIHRQYEELRREKDNLSSEHTFREQTFRSELEQITAEKDAFWQQRFNDECDRLRQENAQLQNAYDEQTRSFTDRLEIATAQNSEYLQRWNILQTESSQKIDELTTKLQEYQYELTGHKEQQNKLTDTSEQQREELIRIEKEKNATIQDLNGQIEVYKDQVRQFSKTIVQLEKNLAEEQEKRMKVQTELDNVDKHRKVNRLPTPPAPVETVVPVVSVLTAPIADLSQELFAHKARIQEQEQIIISLRRDLAGMTARLSDVQGELSEKQKRALEKSEFTIREQTKELNDTRLKLSKLSDIVDKQSTQIESLQSDLSKSKVLANQYQLLVDQRQADIDRLTKSLEEKNLLVERVEKTNQNEGRITHELVAIGAQCKGERHEQTIGRQREALNELRARIKSLEQSRPANPSYEKVLQQVVLLKRELAELRARQALPTDIPYLTTTPGSNSFNQTSTTSFRQSPSGANTSDITPEAQKIIEERTAHA
ncbi:unnamed protein product, partial [Rotaria sp. Silwood2]